MVEWIILNKEWIFSGLGLSLIGIVFSIFKLKNNSGNSIKSTSKGNSSTFQAGNTIESAQNIGQKSIVLNTNTVNLGLTEEAVKTIVQKNFEENFYKLSEQANKLVKQRFDHFTQQFLIKLFSGKHDEISSILDPDIQYAIYRAQRTYARSGDKELETFLVDLLIDRMKENEEEVTKIVLNESINKIGNLIPNQWNILSLVFLITLAKKQGIDSAKGPVRNKMVFYNVGDMV